MTRLANALSPGRRFRAWLRPGRWTYLFTALLVCLLCVGVTVLVYQGGGTQSVLVHLGYLPIVLSALVFEAAGGIVVAVLMGLLVGPFMPLDMVSAEAQATVSWLVRTGFFVAFGAVVGTIFSWLRKQWLAMEEAAYTDVLTGLPNARFFEEQSEKVAAAAHPGYLYVVSVNSLPQVTASFGFQAMEEVLRQVATRLTELDVGTDKPTVFRIHMGQFGVWVPEDIHVMPALMEAAGQPVQVEGTPLFQEMTVARSAIFNDVTVGVTRILPEEHVSWAVRRASGAAQWAAESGLTMAEFHPEQEEQRRSRLLLLAELPRAMREGELVPYFHPKIDLATGVIVGCEALVRWRHPEQGLIPPGRFIPYVEQSPLMGELTVFLLRDVAGRVQRWREQGLEVPVAVNISARDLESDDQVSAFIRAARTAGRPGTIEFEVTERQALEKAAAIGSLHRLREAGIPLAIDDYGTGYSSLSHLKDVPATALKIDQAFIRNLETDPADHSLVASTISLAHELDMEVTAEGVESEAVAAILRRCGCDHAQGYLYCQPLPPEEFEDFCRQWATALAAERGMPDHPIPD